MSEVSLSDPSASGERSSLDPARLHQVMDLRRAKGRAPLGDLPHYRGTSLIRNTPLLGPYRRTIIPRVLWWT